MPQSLSRIYLHLIWSTKDRHQFLNNPDILKATHSYLAGAFKTLESIPIQIGGVSDHVHCLVTLPRTRTIADLVKEAKRVSTNWLKEQSPDLSKFHWQGGYSAFSVSQSNVDQVSRYILNQDEHHKKTSFKDEYREFCQRHGVELDERYVWD